MKKKTIKELLILLRDFTVTEKMYDGMCGSIIKMLRSNKINWDERYKLNLYIKNHRPKWGEYFRSEHKNNSHWFKYGLKQPRLDWLDYRIGLSYPKIIKMKKINQNNI